MPHACYVFVLCDGMMTDLGSVRYIIFYPTKASMALYSCDSARISSRITNFEEKLEETKFVLKKKILFEENFLLRVFILALSASAREKNKKKQ